MQRCRQCVYINCYAMLMQRQLLHYMRIYPHVHAGAPTTKACQEPVSNECVSSCFSSMLFCVYVFGCTKRHKRSAQRHMCLVLFLCCACVCVWSLPYKQTSVSIFIYAYTFEYVNDQCRYITGRLTTTCGSGDVRLQPCIFNVQYTRDAPPIAGICPRYVKTLQWTSRACAERSTRISRLMHKQQSSSETHKFDA